MLKCLHLLVLVLSLRGCLADYDEYDLQEFDSYRFSRTQTPENGCRKDILIMWDNSQSIGIANFLVVKKFLKQLIVKLNVSPKGTHLGLLTFSDKWKTRKLLDVGQIQDPKELSKRLDKYDYDLDLMGGETRTGKAFSIANSMFRSNNSKNHRDDVDDVVLLFTDGRPETDKVEETSEETTKANKYAELLKQKGIRIVCISAGEKEQVYEYTRNLILWATDPSLVIRAGFDKLKIEENVDALAKKLITPLCGDTVVEPARCGCKGGGLSFKVYAQPGEYQAVVRWVESDLVTCTEGTYNKGEADRKSGESFSLGKHSIVQRYWYNDNKGKRVNFQCTVNFTVSVCGCPGAQQVTAERLSGSSGEASVTWNEPHPNCPAMPNPNNPTVHAGMFTAGEHTVLYRYRVQNRFDLRCPVSVIVPGEFCGDIAYDPDTHVCCCGNIYGKKDGDHKCCGTKYINSSKKMCCQGNKPVERPGPCPKM